jgi:hypothetical protein
VEVVVTGWDVVPGIWELIAQARSIGQERLWEEGMSVGTAWETSLFDGSVTLVITPYDALPYAGQPTDAQGPTEEDWEVVAVEFLLRNESPNPNMYTGLSCYLEDGAGEHHGDLMGFLQGLTQINTSTVFFFNPQERIRTMKDFAIPVGAKDVRLVCETPFWAEAVIDLGPTPVTVDAPGKFAARHQETIYEVGDTVEAPEGHIFLTVDDVTFPPRVAELEVVPGLNLIAVDLTLENRGVEAFSPGGLFEPDLPLEVKDARGWRYLVGWWSQGHSMTIRPGEEITGQAVFRLPDDAEDPLFVFQVGRAGRVFVSLP